MQWKIVAVTSNCAFIALLSAVLLRDYFGKTSDFEPSSVLTQIKQLNQLVTVKYSIQRVVGLREPKKPVGEESILLMVQGQTLAGVDLASLTSEDVSYIGKHSVIVRLPPARLLEAFLDEKQTKVWDRQITWWTPWVPYDPDLEHKARLQAIDELRSAALGMGILDQAQRNAQIAIRNLLSAFNVQASFRMRALD